MDSNYVKVPILIGSAAIGYKVSSQLYCFIKNTVKDTMHICNDTSNSPLINTCIPHSIGFVGGVLSAKLAYDVIMNKPLP